MTDGDSNMQFPSGKSRLWQVLLVSAFLTACGGGGGGSSSSDTSDDNNQEQVTDNSGSDSSGGSSDSGGSSTDTGTDDTDSNADSDSSSGSDTGSSGSGATDDTTDSGNGSTTDSGDNSSEDNNSTDSGSSTDNTGGSSADNNADSGSNSGGATDDSSAALSAENQAARFLTQATFGPTEDEIASLTNSSTSDWFLQQLDVSPSYLMPWLDYYTELAPGDEEEESLLRIEAATMGFWRNSVSGQDQLRQRMAFALSELLVVSNGGGEALTDIPEAVIYYQDKLIEHAFGNYRDVLEAVTYSPAMGYYLTYLGSEKGDPETGRMPDENYARELLQLFTIGLVELNKDGTEKVDSQGNTIETYTNKDITGLARVFTGFNPDYSIEDNDAIDANLYAYPMAIEEESHSELEKSFLGFTIPAGTDGPTSTDLALDFIFLHDNVAPFVGKQLIQRLVTSNPSAAYVERVSNAFETGRYSLPNGQSVGKGLRGDLTATLAAILFDTEAQNMTGVQGGKIREPILRFTHWARAFEVESVTPEFNLSLWDTASTSSLAQHPYRAPSVFNFFRPGYVAPGSVSAAQNMVAPELQIVNATSIPGYINFITGFIFRDPEDVDVEEFQEELNEEGINLDAEGAVNSFQANYDAEIAQASNIDALLDHLDLKLTYGTLSNETRQAITDVLQQLPVEDDGDRLERVRYAVLMIMTSPDYLVQQ